MAKFPPTYTESESKMLIAIYENADVSYDTSLTLLLNPGMSPSLSEYEKASKSTLKAIEQLIVVDGKQLKAGLGMYFNELKVNFKGKQEAIQERDRLAELNKQLPKIVAEANALVEEMSKTDTKK